MTITKTTSLVKALGNGATTEWPFAFNIPSSDEIEVSLYVAATGVRTDLTYGVDYTATGFDDEDGGTITYPLAGDPLSSSYYIVIRRVSALKQSLDIANQSGFHPESVEDQLDAIVMQSQELDERLSRAPLVAPTASASDLEALATGILILDGIADDISTVAGISSDVTSVAGMSSDIAAVAGVASELTALGAITADITTVAGIDTEIGTVAGISSDVSSVAAVSASVTAVAAIDTEIGTVAGLDTEIAALGAITSDITSVAGIAANVTSVAAIDTEVGTVAGDSADIQTVAGVSSAISTVAGIDTEISSVAGISSDVTSVAGVTADVTTVEGVTSEVSSVAAIDTEVAAVAGITTEIEAVYTNLTAVQNASANALLAEAWATADEDTVVADGEYSAKHYAAKAAENAAGSADNISFTPAGNIAATTVQDALEELDSEKADASAVTAALGDKSDVGHNHDGRYYTESEIDSQMGDKVPTSRTVSTGTGLTGGGNLSANRTLNLDFASQGEAEAGTNETKAMNPLRVKQAIDALASGGGGWEHIATLSDGDAASVAQTGLSTYKHIKIVGLMNTDGSPPTSVTVRCRSSGGIYRNIQAAYPGANEGIILDLTIMDFNVSGRSKMGYVLFSDGSAISMGGAVNDISSAVARAFYSTYSEVWDEFNIVRAGNNLDFEEINIFGIA